MCRMHSRHWKSKRRNEIWNILCWLFCYSFSFFSSLDSCCLWQLCAYIWADTVPKKHQDQSCKLINEYFRLVMLCLCLNIVCFNCRYSTTNGFRWARLNLKLTLHVCHGIRTVIDYCSAYRINQFRFGHTIQTF